MGINVDQQFFDSFHTAFQQGDTNLASKSEEADNIRLVEQMYRLIAQNDFEALGETLADDVIFEVVGSLGNPLVGYAQGRNQVVEAARNNFQLLNQAGRDWDTQAAAFNLSSASIFSTAAVTSGV